MVVEHIVVDGSNIATEGRSAPSLAQLETACAELRREYTDAEVTVIVDATFAHRIDPSELDRFEAAVLAGEYVHPPAGAIGRGDAFLLRVAEKVDATVLSNDSFQEFHGEHPWLFERGRLIGGTPVPGVGWIFTPRTPVRGPMSRKAVKDTVRAKKKVSKAIEVATQEVVSPGRARAARGDRERPAATPSEESRARSETTAAVVNDPLTFISFIADHPLGATVEGTVQSYTSHGAVVMMGTAQGYVPLANLADPPPRSAREVLKRGEHRSFVVKALDPMRRGVELALPGVSAISGTPSDEMIAAEMQMAKKKASVAKRTVGRKAAKKTGTAGATAARTGTAKTGRAKAAASKGAGGSAATARPAGGEAAPAATAAIETPQAEIAPPDAEAPRARTRRTEAGKTSPAPPASGRPKTAGRPRKVKAVAGTTGATEAEVGEATDAVPPADSPGHPAPVAAAPVKAAPVAAAPVAAAPVKAAPVKAAPVKAAPVKAAPVKAAPAKAAPAKRGRAKAKSTPVMSE
jgi:hypothetical protein